LFMFTFSWQAAGGLRACVKLDFVFSLDVYTEMEARRLRWG